LLHGSRRPHETGRKSYFDNRLRQRHWKVTAQLFAEEGANVAVNDINLSAVEETANIITKNGYRAISIKANIAESGVVDDMFDKIIQELGRIHIPVNNTGVAGGGPTGNFPVEDLDKIRNGQNTISG
jgi:NAD(P)-dependent dehydrogenase (short-subunit alcohol dehydrogenase family)